MTEKTMSRILILILALGLTAAGCTAKGRGLGNDVISLTDSSRPEDGKQLDQVDMPDATGDLPLTQDLIGDLPQDTLPDITSLIDEGKYWLTVAEPAFALPLFEQAMELSPTDPDAIFGLALARFIHTTELFAMMTNLPAQFLGYQAGDGTTEESENEYIANQLVYLMDQLRLRYQEVDSLLAQIDDPEFSWSIPQAPLYYTVHPMLVYHGRFDTGDIHLLRAMARFLEWFSGTMAAQNWQTDFTLLFVTLDTITGGGADFGKILAAIGMLMDEDPLFFTLNDKLDEEAMQRISDAVLDIGTQILAAFDYLDGEEQSEDDVTSLEFEQGDRILVVRNYSWFEDGQQHEEPMRIRMTEQMLQLSRNLVSAVEQEEPLPFSQSMGLQLATILGIAVKLELISKMGISLPLDISHLEIDEIHTLLTGLLPDSVAMNWGLFQKNPKGIRVILPLLTNTGTDLEGSVMEWECPAELAENDGHPAALSGFMCSKGADLTDGPHFLGTEYELAQDGFKSRMPYMIWDDPTINDFILVDENFGTGEPASFVEPDLGLLNMGLHRWLAQILGLI